MLKGIEKKNEFFFMTVKFYLKKLGEKKQWDVYLRIYLKILVNRNFRGTKLKKQTVNKEITNVYKQNIDQNKITKRKENTKY